MYGELIEDLREGLAVSAENDATILRGVKKAAKQLLKVYNFREAVRRAVVPILATQDFAAIPADAGKIKLVWLTTVEGGSKLYKVLRRRGEGQLPTYAGPNFYFVQGSSIYIDQPMPSILATPYNLEIWYQSNDATFAEDFLSTTYSEALEHLAGIKLAMVMRKPEAAAAYGQLWQQDTVILARYTSELEFGDMDMGMGEPRSVLALDRYQAG